jgi:RNA polymerase sigma-70 factor (ECF subfamily)
MSQELSFADLLARMRDGDQDAATQVFNRYVQRLIGLARARLSARARQKVGDDAVVQSALFSFFRNHTGEVDLQSEDSLWAKLAAGILRHCGKWNKRFRAAKRNRAEVPLHAGTGEMDREIELSADEPDPEEVALLADEVEHLLSELTPPLRETLQLRLQGDTVADIARKMQLSESLIYRRLKQIEDKARARLERLNG